MYNKIIEQKRITIRELIEGNLIYINPALDNYIHKDVKVFNSIAEDISTGFYHERDAFIAIKLQDGKLELQDGHTKYEALKTNYAAVNQTVKNTLITISIVELANYSLEFKQACMLRYQSNKVDHREYSKLDARKAKFKVARLFNSIKNKVGINQFRGLDKTDKNVQPSNLSSSKSNENLALELGFNYKTLERLIVDLEYIDILEGLCKKYPNLPTIEFENLYADKKITRDNLKILATELPELIEAELYLIFSVGVDGLLNKLTAINNKKAEIKPEEKPKSLFDQLNKSAQEELNSTIDKIKESVSIDSKIFIGLFNDGILNKDKLYKIKDYVSDCQDITLNFITSINSTGDKEGAYQEYLNECRKLLIERDKAKAEAKVKTDEELLKQPRIKSSNNTSSNLNDDNNEGSLEINNIPLTSDSLNNKQISENLLVQVQSLNTDEGYNEEVVDNLNKLLNQVEIKLNNIKTMKIKSMSDWVKTLTPEQIKAQKKLNNYVLKDFKQFSERIEEQFSERIEEQQPVLPLVQA